VTPRVHVSCGFLPEEEVLALAPRLEERGIDGLTLPDHVFIPDTPPGSYPYSADGQPPFALDAPWPDALVLAGAVGTITERIAITTGVHIVSLRHPLLLGKAIATAARLCGGRLQYGMGVGWQREEFDALGVPFERRGRLADDAIVAMRTLWAEGSSSHRGPERSFGPLLMEPKPPPIPIIVGGDSDAALRRAARLGDGHFMPGRPLDQVGGEIARLRAALAAERREDDAGFRVFMPCTGATAAQIARALEPIVTDLVLTPWPFPGRVTTTVAEKLEHLDRWRADVLEPLRARAR
jgi:probable F420-dependent oxidoreductase